MISFKNFRKEDNRRTEDYKLPNETELAVPFQSWGKKTNQFYQNDIYKRSTVTCQGLFVGVVGGGSWGAGRRGKLPPLQYLYTVGANLPVRRAARYTV